MNGLGRPKEFSGKEEDFQQRSKETEAFFAGVIKESEMILEWSAEQTTEIATGLINRELLPTATNQERGVQNLEFVLQQMHTALMALTSYDGERHCCQLAEESVGGMAETAERCDLPQEEEEKLSSHDHFSGTLLSSRTPSEN